MTTKLETNSQVRRRTLASQLDRLDEILDGLSAGLNEAVSGAVKEALQAVLTEVLTNPALLEHLQPTASPEPALWQPSCRGVHGQGRRCE